MRSIVARSFSSQKLLNVSSLSTALWRLCLSSLIWERDLVSDANDVKLGSTRPAYADEDVGEIVQRVLSRSVETVVFSSLDDEWWWSTSVVDSFFTTNDGFRENT